MSLSNWLLLVILSVLWGGSFFFVEVALIDVSPLTLVFLRVALASLVLLVYLTWHGKKLPSALCVWRSFFVMGLLNNVIPFGMIFWGQTQITASVASILTATTPIFAVVIAHFLTTDERLAWHKLLGVLCGFTGVVVMMLPTFEQGLSLESYGQFSILIAAMSYALAGVWGKRLKDTPPLVNAFGMLICSTFILLPIIFLIEDPFALTLSMTTHVTIVALALLSTALSYILYFKILASAGATNLLLVTFLIPISAMLLGMGILDEQVAPIAFYGMGIIFMGLILIDGRLVKKC